MSDAELDHRIAAALGAPVRARAGSTESVMTRVRAVPDQERPRRRQPRFGVRVVRHTLAGALLAAGVASVAALTPLVSTHDGQRGVLATAVIGDSVSATLRDTVRLVRLMFHDTSAQRVAVVGAFNGWSADSTPLHRDPVTRHWSATVALRDGAHRYAFVVDGTHWAIDPATPRVRGDDGRLYSLLNVSRARPN